jgi:hypothetical protein
MKGQESEIGGKMRGKGNKNKNGRKTKRERKINKRSTNERKWKGKE